MIHIFENIQNTNVEQAKIFIFEIPSLIWKHRKKTLPLTLLKIPNFDFLINPSNYISIYNTLWY